jgi:hypothetical protein
MGKEELTIAINALGCSRCAAGRSGHRPEIRLGYRPPTSLSRVCVGATRRSSSFTRNKRPMFLAVIRIKWFEVVESAGAEGVAILEFPALAEAKAWYASPAYQEASQHRCDGSRCLGAHQHLTLSTIGKRPFATGGIACVLDDARPTINGR